MSNKILNNIHHSVKSLYDNRVVDKDTMLAFDELLLGVEPISKTAIVKLRRREKVSQAVFAQLLNVTLSTVKMWEAGKRRPAGAELRLLQIIKYHGSSIIFNL